MKLIDAKPRKLLHAWHVLMTENMFNFFSNVLQVISVFIRAAAGFTKAVDGGGDNLGRCFKRRNLMQNKLNFGKRKIPGRCWTKFRWKSYVFFLKCFFNPLLRRLFMNHHLVRRVGFTKTLKHIGASNAAASAFLLFWGSHGIRG